MKTKLFSPKLIYISLTSCSLFLAACNGAGTPSPQNNTGAPASLSSVKKPTLNENRSNVLSTNRHKIFNVGVHSPIIVKLDENINPDSVTAQSFTVTDKSGKVIDGTILSSDKAEYTFKPAADLEMNQEYTVALKPGIGKVHTYTFATQTQPYKMYEAYNPSAGNMRGTHATGIGGADYLCNTNGYRPDTSGKTQYKALLAAADVRIACKDTSCNPSDSLNWVLKAYTDYYLPAVKLNYTGQPLVLATTNQNAIFPSTLTANGGWDSSMVFWTGLNYNGNKNTGYTDWTTSPYTCQGWSSADSSQQGMRGYLYDYHNGTSPVAFAISDFKNTNCSNGSGVPLLCVEQPANIVTPSDTPTNGTYPTDTDIQIQFAYAVQADTVNTQTVKVVSSDGTEVAGKVSMTGDTPNVSFRFSPDKPLHYNSKYTATVTSVIDGVGETAPTFSNEFTTASIPPVTMTSPANVSAASLKAPISLQFGDTVESCAFTLSPNPEGTMSGSGTNVCTFTPKAVLNPATTYTLSILAGSMNYTNGSPVDNATFNFTTTPMARPINTESAPTNTILRIQYPSKIDEAKLTDANFYVTVNGSDIHIPGSVNQYVKESYAVISFVSAANYNYSQNYTVHVQNLTMSNGAAIANSTYNFTTAASTAMPDLIIYEASNNGIGYRGDSLGGIKGADAICNSDPAKPAAPNCKGSCVFKAMLGYENDAGNGRFGCKLNGECGDGNNANWVLMRNQNYVTAVQHSLIWTTNNDGVYYSTLSHPIEEADGIYMTDHLVWTGLSGLSWSILNNGDNTPGNDGNCGGWGTVSIRSMYGNSGSGAAMTPAYYYDDASGPLDGVLDGEYSKNCKINHAIYCVEQPAAGSIWSSRRSTQR